jgi:hypothetical protein
MRYAVGCQTHPPMRTLFLCSRSSEERSHPLDYIAYDHPLPPDRLSHPLSNSIAQTDKVAQAAAAPSCSSAANAVSFSWMRGFGRIHQPKRGFANEHP